MSDFTTTSIDYAKIDSIAQLKHAEKVSEFSKSNCLFYKHLIFMYFCPIINF